MNYVVFDLEGPLCPQDNAYELMKLFPGGQHIFEIISLYDDLLALDDREGYEPGNTLALIVPFLAYHGIGEECIISVAEKAALTRGARELIDVLRSHGWRIFCASTSYRPFALRIAGKLNITPENVACTSLSLNEYHKLVDKASAELIRQMEKEFLSFSLVSDQQKMKERLDRFYNQELPRTAMARILDEVKPVGGMRKVKAVQRFASIHSAALKQFIVVGDSITDFKMLDVVNKEGGLAVVFNGNEYALPLATASLASTDICDLDIVFGAWEKGGRVLAEEIVSKMEKKGGSGNRGHFHWLTGKKDLAQIIKIHKYIRSIVRESAGKLG